MFILASKSPRRVKLLKQAGYDFICLPSNINESEIDIYPPFTPIELATTKALHIAQQYPDQLVLGADTIIYFQGSVIGKPENIDDAKNTLLKLSGHEHQVITGVSLIKLADHTYCSFVDISNVKFRKLNRITIDGYLAQINPLDKAGAYAIQEHGSMIIEKVTGSKNNIMGLPTEKLFKTLNILLKN